MTLKEAKKILKKEGYFLVKVSKGFEFSELPVWEKPEVVEAKRVVNENGFATAMNTNEWLDRQEHLKKEYGKNHIKGDFSWKNSIIPGSPALKESASQFNDALLDEQAKKIKRLGKEIARLNGIIHDKNAVLADVAEELRLTKIREKNLVEVSQKYMKENEELREKVAEKTKLVEMVRKGSKEYCEYGIAAEKMIRKTAKVIVDKGFICSEDFEKYRLWANGYRFNHQLTDFSEEEEKKPSFFRDDSVGAVTNLKDCSPAKDTHPTEDNPEEVKMNEILEYVRKVLEEGGTVTTSYDKAEEGGDQSATIVQHGKSIVDLFKEIKRLWQE